MWPLNWIDTLQQLRRQLDRQNDRVFHFSGLGKYLQKKLGVNRVALLQRINGSFKPEGDHGGASMSLPVSAVRFMEKKNRPWFAEEKRKNAWSGLWPILVDGELAACFAVGWKPGAKTLEAEERIIVELAAERTELLFREHCLWKHLDHSNRLASLGLMSAALAHEIRNPLTALSTLAQLLPSKRNDERFMKTFEELVPREILRLTKLTESFLSFSKADLEKTGRVDFAKTVEAVVQLLGPLFSNKNVTLKVRAGSGLFIQGNSAQIESLVLNLLQNAFQSVEPEGKIEISASLLQKNPCGTGAWIRLQVKDNGQGFSKNDLQKLFSPFFSTKCDGTGLGLFLCRKIVQNHGGVLKATGCSGKGATFSVFLPALIKKP
jgi:signal transduction histidine kinase